MTSQYKTSQYSVNQIIKELNFDHQSSIQGIFIKKIYNLIRVFEILEKKYKDKLQHSEFCHNEQKPGWPNPNLGRFYVGFVSDIKTNLVLLCKSTTEGKSFHKPPKNLFEPLSPRDIFGLGLVMTLLDKTQVLTNPVI